MLWGWIISSLCVWFMAPALRWKECMVCAACFSAIDPILAATVIGRGRFGKRIPKHLRNLAFAESGINGITTTLVFGLSIQVLKYSNLPRQLTYRVFVLTTAYEVLFGAFAGLVVGLSAYKAAKFCERKQLVDRPSFLAFYMVMALFCTGLGSLLGVDEILLGFCAGYAFDRQDWFQRKTESEHLSTVVDLLLNLSFFVLLGAIIPWHTYNMLSLRLVPWRLVLGVIFIFTFRRIPALLIFKPLIPDIKTWREALFYGHFGPIGAGSIFSALLVKAQLSSGRSKEIGNLQNSPFGHLDATIWPIVTFVVVCSSIFHGSSIPIFIIARGANKMSIVLSYPHDEPEEPGWMSRLPRIISPSPAPSTDIQPPERFYMPGGRIHPRHSVTSSTDNQLGQASTVQAHTPGPSQQRGPAHAHHFGNTIVVENEDGDVIKTYTMPATGEATRTTGGRLPTRNFIRQMQQLDPRANITAVDEEDDPVGQARSSKGKGKPRLEPV